MSQLNLKKNMLATTKEFVEQYIGDKFYHEQYVCPEAVFICQIVDF